MSGLIVLAGGCEHRAGWEPIGRGLLELTGADRPRVALVPVASSRRKQPLEVERAWASWSSLGAAFGVADHRGIRDEAEDALGESDIVVLSGGVPARLYEALAGSWIWERIVELWQRGAIVVGSSAGAMELLEWRLAARGAGARLVAPGLGLFGGCVVAPHFDRYEMHRVADAVVRRLGGLALVGVDERTVLVGRQGRFRVIGEGAVTVVRRGGRSRHVAGAEFPIEQLREACLPVAPGQWTTAGEGQVG